VLTFLQKTTEAKVLEAAKTESKNVILVYASERAMDHQNIALPKPLDVCINNLFLAYSANTMEFQTFVRWDNTTFKTEFGTCEESQPMRRDSQTTTDDSQPVTLSSPGKRKFDESSLVNQDSKPYGQVNVSEREIRSSDESVYSNQSTKPKVSFGNPLHPVNEEMIPLVGVDPSLLANNHIDPKGQEMQERTGMPMLAGRPTSSRQSKTIDSMDLDQVVEDADVVEESAAASAVKHEW
jgi:hypothetical protein